MITAAAMFPTNKLSLLNWKHCKLQLGLMASTSRASLLAAPLAPGWGWRLEAGGAATGVETPTLCSVLEKN